MGDPDGRTLVFNTVKAIVSGKDFNRKTLRARLVFFNKNKNGKTPNRNEIRPIAVSNCCQKIIESLLKEKLES